MSFAELFTADEHAAARAFRRRRRAQGQVCFRELLEQHQVPHLDEVWPILDAIFEPRRETAYGRLLEGGLLAAAYGPVPGAAVHWALAYRRSGWTPVQP